MIDDNNAYEPKVEAENNSIAIGGLSIGGDISGQVNIANGHIIHAEKGSTVIIGTPAEAVSGLVALRELMQRSSDVRTAVIAFQTDFKVAHEQVDLLGDYKDIHDLLHQLQFYCYNSIMEAATRFPEDEMAVDNLTRYAADLERIMEGLQDVAERRKIPRQEILWIEDAGHTRVNLQNAIDLLDKRSLQKVTLQLNRLLSIQPARVDTLLNLAARTLRLPTLLSTLTSICDHISTLELDRDRVTAFQSGLDALHKLDRALSELVEDHNRWQVLDVELRLIDASINRDLVEFEVLWPDIKLKSELLYAASTEEWAEAMRKEGSALDEALGNNYPEKIPQCFHRYQRRVTNRFFRVDTHLKSLCGDLRQIGVPLASVLRMVQ